MAPSNPPNPTNTKMPGQNGSPRPSISRPSPSKTPSVNGLGRSPSLRGSISRPGRGGSRASPQTSFLSTNTTASDDANDDETRAQRASLMDELRNRVEKAETASEEYLRQLHLLQARLDEAQQVQSNLEDRLHESNEKVEELEVEKVQATRQRRDTDTMFETERAGMIQDRKEQTIKTEELQETIKRLKDNLAQRELRNSGDEEKTLSKSSSGKFAPSSASQRSESQERSKAIVQQKDRVIQSLRLELAEAQIKIMEIDSLGGSKEREHELEKQLMETRVTNARLQEDNESFQLLLSERTLNGDFGKAEAMQTSSGLGSLAEELGGEDLDSPEGKSDETRRLETEVQSLKDQNKALALYIESIIGRLLQHKEFENILDKTPDLISGAPRPQTVDKNKELPPPPPPKDEEGGTSFLQRARSVVGGSGRRSRPTSVIQPAPLSPPFVPPTAPNEDPNKAPSIPINRSASVRNSNSHRRSQSDLPNAGAAPLVNQMYRGPPSTGSGPMMSPGISPGVTGTTRSSFFSPAASVISPNATPRAASGSQFNSDRNPESSSNSTFSEQSGGLDSPPRSNTAPNNFTGAVMTQNRLRPLRLVQENHDPETERRREEEAAIARKKANRGSWMPSWASRGLSGENHPP